MVKLPTFSENLDEEIKKTNEFMMTLKELQSQQNN